MTFLKKTLSPSGQNSIQRKGYFTTLTVFCLILLLHFPFEGYEIDQYVITRYGHGNCPRPSLDEAKKMTIEQLNKYGDDIKRCNNDVENQIRPFSDWRSNAPIIQWFGNVLHALIAAFFTYLIGGLWIWIFRSRDNDEGSSS